MIRLGPALGATACVALDLTVILVINSMLRMHVLTAADDVNRGDLRPSDGKGKNALDAARPSR